MRFRIASFLALLFLLCPSPAAGQASSTATGIITGQVTDATGAVLAGVAATLTSPALMGPRTALTTPAGAYRFTALPPGTYALTLTRDGFAPATRDDIYVAAGFTATIDVTMGLQAFAEDARVSGSTAVPSTGVRRPLATTFNAAQLANLPGSRTDGSGPSAPGRLRVSASTWAAAASTPASYGAYGTSGFNRPMVEGRERHRDHDDRAQPRFRVLRGESRSARGHTGRSGIRPACRCSSSASPAAIIIAARSSPTTGHGTGSRSTSTTNSELRGAAGMAPLPPREANRLWSYYDVNADLGGYIKPDTALVVSLVSRSGHRRAAGELPGGAASHAFDQLHGQGHLSAYAGITP